MDRYFDETDELEMTDEQIERRKQNNLNNALFAAKTLIKNGAKIDQISERDEEKLIRYIIDEGIDFTE